MHSTRIFWDGQEATYHTAFAVGIIVIVKYGILGDMRTCVIEWFLLSGSQQFESCSYLSLCKVIVFFFFQFLNL